MVRSQNQGSTRDHKLKITDGFPLGGAPPGEGGGGVVQPTLPNLQPKAEASSQPTHAEVGGFQDPLRAVSAPGRASPPILRYGFGRNPAREADFRPGDIIV